MLIKQVKFFKDKTSLTKSDIRDLASNFKFESFNCLDSVINYGDKISENNDKFYIILRGIVSVSIPNPIENRKEKL